MTTRVHACHAAALGPRPGAAHRRLLAAWVAMACLMLAATNAAAHGVEMTSGSGQACWVKAEYAGGESMAFAKVQIMDPQGRTHQVGHADGQGRFAWVPDQAGAWSAQAEDGMGHRGELVVQAGPDPAAPPAPRGQELGAVPLWARAAWGLSFIWGLSGAIFYWKARGSRPRRPGR